MKNEVLETIERRRSVRNYKPDQIEEETLKAIVKAGQYAPNAGGEAWHFTVIQDAEMLARMNRLAKQYASACGLSWLEDLGSSESFHSIYHAPALILVSSDQNNIAAQADTAAATQNILLAAESLGVGSCWGYFVTQAFQSEEGESLKQELKIPEGYQIYTSVILGYKAEETPPAAERRQGTVTFIGF